MRHFNFRKQERPVGLESEKTEGPQQNMEEAWMKRSRYPRARQTLNNTHGVP